MQFNVSAVLESFAAAISGIGVTLEISVITLIVSIPLGFLLALVRHYKVPVFRQLIALLVSFIRGVPVIIQIFIVYYVLPRVLTATFTAHGINFNVYEMSPMVYAFVVFIISTMAVLSEVFRSALAALNKGQLEAAHAIGMTTVQAYRRILIPQIVTTALPNIGNTTLILLKNTSLVYYFGVLDITAKARLVAADGFHYFEAYFAIFVVYLVLCILTDYLFRIAEKRIRKY